MHISPMLLNGPAVPPLAAVGCSREGWRAMMKCKVTPPGWVRRIIFVELVVFMNYWSNVSLFTAIGGKPPPPDHNRFLVLCSRHQSEASHRGTLHLLWCARCFLVCFTHGWILGTWCQTGNMVSFSFSPPVAKRGTAETNWGPKDILNQHAAMLPVQYQVLM